MARFLILALCAVAAFGCQCTPETDGASSHMSCRLCSKARDGASCKYEGTMWVRHMKHYVDAQKAACKKGTPGCKIDLSDWNDAGHAHKCVHDKLAANGCACCDCKREATAAPTTAGPVTVNAVGYHVQGGGYVPGSKKVF